MTIDSNAMLQVAKDYAAAWCSGDPVAVASHYASNGQIIINRGDPHIGTAAMIAMATGFYGEFPDLVVHLDEFRMAGSHAVFTWTLEGHHSATGNHVKVKGWEEWELDDQMKVVTSLGWFDAEEYDRQVAGT